MTKKNMLSKAVLIILILVNMSFVSGPAFAQSQTECVILLHGMGRSHHSMAKIESRLNEQGYAVWNQSYASTSDTIESLSQSAISDALQFCAQAKATKIHFVTHSLGGILVRVYLQDNAIDKLGRIVMMAPPNQGSELVDLLKDYSLYEMSMGPAGQALGTLPNSLPNRLRPIAGEIGVIAGNATSDPWFSPLIEGDDDGKVSVKRTKLKEMVGFLIVDAGHTFIMRNNAVIEQIKYFLRYGKFND